jgi:hypothetical protein
MRLAGNENENIDGHIDFPDFMERHINVEGLG